MAGFYETLMSLGQGLSNGAQSFGDQAQWAMGKYGNAPQPAPYAGGPDYPTKDDANAYVRNNYPSDGTHNTHASRPETLYTPEGINPPPGGRGPTIGETIDGAPHYRQLAPWFLEFLAQHNKRNSK